MDRDPEMVDALIAKGKSLHELKRFAESLKCLEDAVNACQDEAKKQMIVPFIEMAKAQLM